MIRMRLRPLGLCAMVFALMSFNAAAAHAEEGAKWLYAEKDAGTNLVVINEPEIELEKDSSVYVLHSEILKMKTLFLCTDLKIAGTPKLIANGGISSGKVLFSGCVTDLPNKEGKLEPVAACQPKDATEGVAGTILTKGIHSLIVLHELFEKPVDDILKLLPDEGNTFATIELPATCPIGTKVPVIGSLALEDCNGLALTHLVKHLVKPFEPLTKLWTISETAEHAATLLGSAWGYLKGEGKEYKFSGDPK